MAERQVEAGENALEDTGFFSGDHGLQASQCIPRRKYILFGYPEVALGKIQPGQ